MKLPDCQSCPFSKHGRPQPKFGPVLADGPEKAPLALLVGESPGYTEVQTGHPFSGPTGEELNELLANAGLPRFKLRVVNAIACMPPDGLKTTENMGKAAKACRPLFLAQAPTAIPTLAMGKWASWATNEKGKAIANSRGFIRKTPLSDQTIFTWHPTYALFHNPWEMGNVEVDIDRLYRMVVGKLAPEGKVFFNPSVQTLKMLHKKKRLSCDIETLPESPDKPWTGKDPTRARLKIIGFGTADEAWVIHWKSANWEKRKWIKKILANRRIRKDFQNGWWFDLRVLARYGMTCLNVWDTRDARRAISSTSKLSLGYLVSIYDDSDPWKEKTKESGEDKVQFMMGNLKKVMLYNGKDCFKTARVSREIRKEADWNTPRVQQLYHVHRDVSRIAAEMHSTGIHVNWKQREFMIWCCDLEYKQKRRKFLERVNLPGMRCTPNDMRALMWKRHETKAISRFSLPDPWDEGWYTDETLETISTDEGVLLNMIASQEYPKELTDIIDLYWAARQTWKKRGYIVSKKFTQNVGNDGRLRPSWNSCGTDTMRFSCRDPNVMQWEQMVRGMLGAPKGRVLVHMDKSQLELRVMASVSGDSVLQQRLDLGDVYTEDAKDWFNLPKHWTKKDLKGRSRHQAKIIHLAKQYRASDPTVYTQTLAEDRTIEYATVRLLSKGFDSTYEQTVAWWDEVLKRVLELGYNQGHLLDGRRYYPRPPTPQEAANWDIQRTAGEMMMLEIRELHKRLQSECQSAKIIIQLHDAFDVECDVRHETKVRRIMTEVSDREYTICGRTRRFPVEMKSSADWSEV